LKHHVVGSFDLAVAPRVRDRGLIDADGVFLAKVPEDGAGESFAQVGDDPVRHAKAMCDVSDEFYRFFLCYFCNRLDFNPLEEFVDSHQYMFVATWAVRNGPTASRPHIAKSHDGGMVPRA
jgi:hypothetical protein